MKSLQILAFLYALLALVSCAPANDGKPLIPQEDSFYDDPADLESYELGDLIKIRRTPHQLRGFYLPVTVKESWQIMVRSSDVVGNATAIVATIIEPFNSDPSKLVAYNMAEDAASENCAPSYTLLYGSNMDTLVAQTEMYFIQGALNQGWWIVVPDYEGKNLAFCAGRKAGKSILDTVRGTIKTNQYTGLNEKPDIVMWGYSGGSLAAGWAASLQPSYAPELKPLLRGAALGGWMTNVTESLVAWDNSLYAGLIPNGLMGLSREYPEFGQKLQSYMDPSRWNTYLSISKNCLFVSILETAYATIFGGASEEKLWFPGGFFQDPTVNEIMSDTSIGMDETLIPDIPLFIYHGLHDGIVPLNSTFKIYDQWSKAGIESMEVSISNGTRHLTEMLFGCPAVITWFEKAFKNDTIDGTLLTYRSSNLDYPGVASELIEYVIGAGRTLLNTNLGPLLSADGVYISTLTGTQGDGNTTVSNKPTLNERGLEDLDEIVEMYLEDIYLNKKKRSFF